MNKFTSKDHTGASTKLVSIEYAPEIKGGRYVIYDAKTKTTLENAQGYGFSTYEKAENYATAHNWQVMNLNFLIPTNTFASKVFDKFLGHKTATFETPLSKLRVTFDSHLMSDEVDDVICILENNHFEHMHTAFINLDMCESDMDVLWGFCHCLCHLTMWWTGLEFHNREESEYCVRLTMRHLEEFDLAKNEGSAITIMFRDQINDASRIEIIEKVSQFIGCEIMKFLSESIGKIYTKTITKPDVKKTFDGYSMKI